MMIYIVVMSFMDMKNAGRKLSYFASNFVHALFAHEILRFLLLLQREFERKGYYCLAEKEFNGLPLSARKIESRLLFRFIH